MKRNIYSTLLMFVVCYLIFICGLYANEELTGRDIVKMANKANCSSSGIVINGQMELINMVNKKGEKRDFVILTKEVNNMQNVLFRFTSSVYRDTTFLSIERKNKDTLQYVFLKSVGSPRQIKASDKENNFVDTDIANEDMGVKNIDDYTYKRLDDKKIGDKDCYVIESYPKDKKSKYSKHVKTIDKETLISIESKSFNKHNRIAKVIKASDIRKIADNIYRPFELIVVDVKDKHKTVVSLTAAAEVDINRVYFNKMRMNRKIEDFK